MKILFLTDNFPPEPNAAASRVYERAKYWAAWGHDVTILTSTPNKPEGRAYAGFKNEWRKKTKLDGLNVIRVKTYISANEGVFFRMIDFASYMFTSFFFGLFEKRPDVVIATSPQLLTVISGWGLSVVKNVPFVFELADLWPDSIVAVGAMKKNLFIRIFEKIELFLYRRANRIVALSKSFKENLTTRGINPSKIDVILNGVDRSIFSPKPKDIELSQRLNLDSKFVVGYIGTVGAAHGLNTFIQAAEILSSQSSIHFLIVGSGADLNSLQAEAKSKNLKNVTFTGRQDKTLMPRYWSLLDVSLIHLKNSPTFTTAIPSKIFESMGCGKAILIGTPPGEATRIIESTSSGMVVPPDSSKEMASAILKLSQNPELLGQFSMNSLKAANLYSREEQARLLLAACESLVVRSPRVLKAT